jgi:hypothetical protein
MSRYYTRGKHWLLLMIFSILALAMPALARAQSDDQEQYQDQPAEQLNPLDNTHDSHVRIVRISYIEGAVRIDTGHGYESATMNVPVTEHNWLQTRSDGWAEVQLEDGSTIRLAPDTVVAFTELSRTSSGGTVTTVDLDQGEAEFKIAKHDDSDFQVTVKNKSVVLEHSGSFRVTSTNADPMEVVVWKGDVGVVDPETGGEVTVKKNETFVLDATDTAQYALDNGAEADQLDQWSRQRDDYLSTYASGRPGFQSPYQYGAGDLNYYGQYFDDPGYGTLWQPTGVNLGWDPFMNGYWAYSPGFGYTWVSAYPWGWLPYRYGRWVYINHRGWCWSPGGWNSWHTGPRWVNAPPGFRAPVPPAAGTIVVGGSPGRVIRPGTPWDRGGLGRAGNDRDTDRQNLNRGNRRVLTNDDVQGRVPRTDTPAQPQSPSANDADRKPKVIEQQPAGERTDRFRGDRDAPRVPIVSGPDGHTALPAERSRVSTPPPVSAPPSQPVRQFTPPPPPAPPVHQFAPPPPPAPTHQSPPAAAAVQRQSSPAAETHSNEGSRGGRPR